MMTRKVIMAIALIVGLSLGFTLGPLLWQTLGIRQSLFMNPLVNSIAAGIIFILLGSLLAPWIERLIARIIDHLEALPTAHLVMGFIGAFTGLLLGYFLSLPFGFIPVASSILPIIFSLLGGVIGYRLMLNRSEEFLNFFNRGGQRPLKAHPKEISPTHPVATSQGPTYKILDTSAIIDGRIAEVVRTGFIEGTLMVPKFALAELQHIADSADSLKRNKGRRGLDILNALQKDGLCPVEFYEGDYEAIQEVDAKLVQLAKDLSAVLITTDYNLNKVSQFQNVPVLNINELANALKPELIPGEEMRVQILKSGTERRQGVAYLSDGTMVVVEEGADHINEWLNVTVTSSLQTAAGRMIFAKING